MAVSASTSAAHPPWHARVGALLGLIWLACYLEFGLVFASSPIDRWILPAGFDDGEFCMTFGSGPPPNGVMLLWPFHGIPQDWRYALTGVLGVLLYGALIRYVPIRTLSRRGALIVVLYLIGSEALAFFNVLQMFPPPPFH